ncbi:MAG: DNA polymerase III subunit [Prevotellaceae bacterium]|jgi:DNA polymerase-3 subunit delta'|nr:DNA polymerase III subunit [Prevotellaceae bacterium]
MQFSQIIGHQQIKHHFIQSVTEQRIPHAQMISGREGVGKLRLALSYAQYISCTKRTESDACGVCPSCVKYAKLAHPDLHFVFPYPKPEGSKTWVCNDFVQQFREMILKNEYFGIDDWNSFIASGDSKKQSYIFAGESEEIIRKLNLKSYESEYKIVIIWLPEKMFGDIVANKILKILEEPPAKTVFLLVSNQPDLLLPTIISRTQPVYVHPLTESEIVQVLLKNGVSGIAQEHLQRIAHIADGSALNALKIAANDTDNAAHFENFTNLMRAAWRCGAKKEYGALKDLRTWSENIAATGGREQQKKFLNFAQKMLRENYMFNLNQPELNYLTLGEETFCAKFARFIHEKNVEKMMDEFALAEQQINQNANPKIVFFDLALKMIMMLKEN